MLCSPKFKPTFLLGNVGGSVIVLSLLSRNEGVSCYSELGISMVSDSFV